MHICYREIRYQAKLSLCPSNPLKVLHPVYYELQQILQINPFITLSCHLISSHKGPLTPSVRIRLRQFCDDACNIALIDHNIVDPFSSSSILSNESCVTSVIAVLMQNDSEARCKQTLKPVTQSPRCQVSGRSRFDSVSLFLVNFSLQLAGD